MACLTDTFSVASVAFKGKNFTPIESTTMVKLGGRNGGDGVIDVAGRRSGTTKIEGGEVEFEVAATSDNLNSIATLKDVCGDLIVTTAIGINYLGTNAQFGSNQEFKDGEGKVKLVFKCDAMTQY